MAGEYRKLFQDGLELLMATDLAKGRTDRIPDIMTTLGEMETHDWFRARWESPPRNSALRGMLLED